MIGPLAFIVHYGNADDTDPTDMIFMGYTETNSWTLKAADVPAGTSGQKIKFFVQAFNQKATSGSTDVEKARWLHDNHNGDGSAWSTPAEVTIA